MNFTEKLEAVEMKVRELAYKLERIKKENALLREENKKLSTELGRLQREKADPELPLSHQSPDGEHTPGEAGSEVLTVQFKDQLSHYIGEIDKCIEWLDNN